MVSFSDDWFTVEMDENGGQQFYVELTRGFFFFFYVSSVWRKC